MRNCHKVQALPATTRLPTYSESEGLAAQENISANPGKTKTVATCSKELHASMALTVDSWHFSIQVSLLTKHRQLAANSMVATGNVV